MANIPKVSATNPHPSYIPGVSEAKGACLIAVGLTQLSISAITKITDYVTNTKTSLYLGVDPAQCFKEAGFENLKNGVIRLTPATLGLCLALLVYQVSIKRFFE